MMTTIFPFRFRFRFRDNSLPWSIDHEPLTKQRIQPPSAFIGHPLSSVFDAVVVTCSAMQAGHFLFVIQIISVALRERGTRGKKTMVQLS